MHIFISRVDSYALEQSRVIRLPNGCHFNYVCEVRHIESIHRLYEPRRAVFEHTRRPTQGAPDREIGKEPLSEKSSGEILG